MESTAEFNVQISNVIAQLLSFSIIYVISHMTLWKYVKRGNIDLRQRLPLFLCSFGLTVALGAVFLVPFTVLAHDVLDWYPDNIYVMWLNRNIVTELWNYIFIGSSLSFSVVLPFAYFFHETEDYSRYHRKTTRKKLVEASYNLVLLGIIISGIVYVLQGLLFRVTGNSPAYFPFAYSLITLLGGGVIIGAVPSGFIRLIDSFLPLTFPTFTPETNVYSPLSTYTQNEPSRLKLTWLASGWARIKKSIWRKSVPSLQERRRSRHKRFMDHLQQQSGVSTNIFTSNMSSDERDVLPDRIYALMFHKASLEQRLSPSDSSEPYQSTARVAAEHIKLKQELVEVERELYNYFFPKREPFGHTVVRNLGNVFYFSVRLVCVLLVSVTPLATALRTALELLRQMWLSPSWGGDLDLAFVPPFSQRGLFVSLLDIAVILYLTVATLVGLTQLPFLSQLRLRHGNTPLPHLIVLTFFGTTIASSLPVVGRALGLIQFDLMGSFADILYLNNRWLTSAAKVLFLLLMIYKFFLSRAYAIARPYLVIGHAYLVLHVLPVVMKGLAMVRHFCRVLWNYLYYGMGFLVRGAGGSSSAQKKNI